MLHLSWPLAFPELHLIDMTNEADHIFSSLVWRIINTQFLMGLGRMCFLVGLGKQ